MEMVYNNGVFTINHTDDGFLVHNTSMEGFCHTHIKNYGTALRVVELSHKKKCPFSLPRYLLISLYRINSDEKYKKRIEEVLNTPKKDSYVNSRRKR